MVNPKKEFAFFKILLNLLINQDWQEALWMLGTLKTHRFSIQLEGMSISPRTPDY